MTSMADDAEPMEVDAVQKGKAPAVPGDYRDAAADAAPWVRVAPLPAAPSPRTDRIAPRTSERPRAHGLPARNGRAKPRRGVYSAALGVSSLSAG